MTKHSGHLQKIVEWFVVGVGLFRGFVEYFSMLSGIPEWFGPENKGR